MVCSAMRWAHLPVAGGLYDQHPKLLADWMVIFEEKAKQDEAKAKSLENEVKGKVKK